jgi:undecaprenyl-diphosphatase
MPLIDAIRALVLGLVEGATEFIPVSSTGHLIIAGHFLGFTGEKAAVFEIVIQLGAILAVVWQYRKMLMRLVLDLPREREAQRLVVALLVAFLPAAIIGLLTHDWITDHLFRPMTVVMALIVGGLGILLVERLHPRTRAASMGAITLPIALGIGLAQVLSLFPGVSRSAATIMGALALGVARPAAAEFSFLLAIPVMFGASGLELWSSRHFLSLGDFPLFAIGFVTAFISALVAIRFLLRFVAGHTFSGFAWYRIAFGVLMLVGFWQGWWSLVAA